MDRSDPRYGPMWVIGWREWLALPELGITEIKAKIDTGARSSALHAWNVETIRRKSGHVVRFVVHPYQRDSSEIVAEAPLIEERAVRNSGGKVENRPVVLTSARLLGRIWPIELTLTNRDEMGFRMLLGREALRRRFLVDAGRSFLAGRSPRRRRSVRKKKGSAP